MSNDNPHLARLQQAQLQLEAAHQQLQLLTDSVSHDLRAPLRAIESFSARLAESAAAKLDASERDQLQRVRAAAAPGARVLLIEALIPESAGPSWPLTLDLWMLTISGKQRSLDEYAALLAATGFTFTRAIDTPAGVTIVEGTV